MTAGSRRGARRRRADHRSGREHSGGGGPSCATPAPCRRAGHDRDRRAARAPEPRRRCPAVFSSRGLAFDGISKPEVVASGVALLTSDPGRGADGAPAFGTVSGSSAAAAVVAGGAAILASEAGPRRAGASRRLGRNGEAGERSSPARSRGSSSGRSGRSALDGRARPRERARVAGDRRLHGAKRLPARGCDRSLDRAARRARRRGTRGLTRPVHAAAASRAEGLRGCTHGLHPAGRACPEGRVRAPCSRGAPCESRERSRSGATSELVGPSGSRRRFNRRTRHPRSSSSARAGSPTCARSEILRSPTST